MYYICTKTNWQGDSWKPVEEAKTRNEAEKLKEQHEEYPLRQGGGLDLKNQIHAAIFTRTELQKMGFPRGRIGDMAIMESIDAAWREDMHRKGIDI